jgi:hypothetical protein
VGDASPLRNDVTARSGKPRTREHKAKRMEVCGQPARDQSAGAQWQLERVGGTGGAGRSGQRPRPPPPALSVRSGRYCPCVGKFKSKQASKEVTFLKRRQTRKRSVLFKRRTASGDPEGPIKVAVMDTRSGRSGGHNLKGPLECTFYSLWAAYDWIKGRIHSRNNAVFCASCVRPPEGQSPRLSASPMGPAQRPGATALLHWGSDRQFCPTGCISTAALFF